MLLIFLFVRLSLHLSMLARDSFHTLQFIMQADLLLIIPIVWDSLESHDAVAADAEKLAPIYAALDPHLAAPPLIHNVALEPFGLKTLLQGNTMQMVTVEGVSVGVKRGEVGAIVAALNGCPTCRGVEVGETVGDDATKTSILAAGWQGPVSEEDQVKRGAEWWMNEAAKLGPEAKVEMHEVKFMKCYYRA